MNSGWRDLHFHGNLSVARNFKKRLILAWVANTFRCTGPVRIATVYDTTRKIETLVLNTPKNPFVNQVPIKVPAKIYLRKTIPKSKFQPPISPLIIPVTWNLEYLPPHPAHWRILSAPLLMMMGFWKGGDSDFLFKEADKIWILDKYVACQDG